MNRYFIIVCALYEKNGDRYEVESTITTKGDTYFSKQYLREQLMAEYKFTIKAMVMLNVIELKEADFIAYIKK